MKKDFLTLQKEFVNNWFGCYIHFNSATVQFCATKIVDWDEERKKEPARHPFNPEDWNPSQLDCKQWAKTAKAAGMTFGCLTTRHHEGFSIWPTMHSEHCVRNATCKRDVVAEYVKAFRDEGLLPGLYYSVLDLHHEISEYNCTQEGKQFVLNQLTELFTNYGEIPFIIFDGWNAPWGGPGYDKISFEEVSAHIKALQPNCMVLNHSCETNLDHTDIALYENNAGQDYPKGFNGPGALGAILTTSWFWRTTDPTMKLKSADWAVNEKIIPANEHNSVYLMNFSPNTMGLLDDNLVRRYEEIGKVYKKPTDITETPVGWLTK